jgi:hypothetical protein
MPHHLVSHFASAGLDLRLAAAPFATRSADVFQLDIRRLRPHDVRSEHFLAWTGPRNLASVQGVDRRERQLVLVVREGEVEFEEAIPRAIVRLASGIAGSIEWKQSIAAHAGPGISASMVVARTGGASVVRSTRGSTRHMLVGRDERQLFMCALPRACTTVRQAHDALRTPAARSRSRSALERPVRQGEWFFVLPRADELEELERAIQKHQVAILRKRSINSAIPRAGKPHVADELVFAVNGASAAPIRGNVYVRGAIRHLDHKTIHIPDWRRVLRNLEVDSGRSPLGGTWVD